jgi:formylglycine-generating enzyme required for sulfatase activity
MGSLAAEEGHVFTEAPQHEVPIGKYPVTIEEWDAALAAGAKIHALDDFFGWGRGRRPAIEVFWEDAQAYIAFLNDERGLSGRPDRFRLPSEAEWEYACRARAETPFSFGTTISPRQANYRCNHTYGDGGKAEYRPKTTRVGSFPANRFGVHDMHGNVLEWCEDAWHDNYVGAPTDGSAWTSGGDLSQRVLRGGSWNHDLKDLRSARRAFADQGFSNARIGFRLARTVNF